MEHHTTIVDTIASEARRLYKLNESYRVFHGSSNSTRPRHGPGQNVIDISMLRNVLSVNVTEKTCLVEPNVPMDRLVEATMAYGLVPPVVMEFPGITAGGGFSGTSGESSSFRHGFFNATINWVEMILGNGDVVKASRTEHSDLFHGAAGAVGTLGTTTLLEVRLVEAQKFVKTTYQKVEDVAMAITEIRKHTANVDIDYVDGIMYSNDHGVIITGQLTNVKPADYQAQTFSDAADPWFYLHVREKTQHLGSLSSVIEYIPLNEYLFRYDRAGFWVGRQGYSYFKIIPFSKFFRWLLDDYSHTRTLYHALHASGVSSQFVIQDLALPYERAEEFIGWVDRELHVWPLWLCPLAPCNMPSFHPVTAKIGAKGVQTLQDVDPSMSSKEAMSQPMLNIGVWGWGPQNYGDFVIKNRALEKQLTRLGGRKWLYAHSYYDEEEFWKLYGRSWYEALRNKYFAAKMPTVFDKVTVDVVRKAEADSDWWSSWLSKWPIGGLYGMVLATISGDISLHRNAKWKYMKE